MNVVNIGFEPNRYEQMLEQLLESLEPIKDENAEVHQLYLESKWLLSNHKAGVVSLPTKWNLIIFELVKRERLAHLEEASKAARQVCAHLTMATSEHRHVA